MLPPLDGTVLITGASSGIGRELARQLAPRAGGLVLVARRGERLEALRAELKAARPELPVVVAPCDLSDPEAALALVEAVEREAGPVDVLVNNAGLGDVALFERTDWVKLERMIQVNVLALTCLTRQVLPGMLARKRGGILNLSSGFGLTFMPGVAAYAGTKHYVTGFTEALRIELAGTGIVVTQACPGPVATEFEDVSGNPTGRAVPSLVELNVVPCARQIVAGFSRGRAIVQPGWVASALIWMGRLSPRWVLRLLYRPIGGWLRGR